MPGSSAAFGYPRLGGGVGCELPCNHRPCLRAQRRRQVLLVVDKHNIFRRRRLDARDSADFDIFALHPAANLFCNLAKLHD